VEPSSRACGRSGARFSGILGDAGVAASRDWFNQTVPILRDAKTAQRIIKNLIRSRLHRRELARRGPAVSSLAPDRVQIAVYFADTKVNLYQMRQWYAPLAELSKTRPVAIIARSPGAALALIEESPVPVVYLRTVSELENFVASQALRITFYVNQNSKNFQMFRYGRMWHVFINHGESDKMYMTTNQWRAQFVTRRDRATAGPSRFARSRRSQSRCSSAGRGCSAGCRARAPSRSGR
jgi:hypothetical protein